MSATSTTRSIAAAPTQPLTGSVVSQDGTRLGFRRLGAGPGLVVLHGAMQSSLSHLQLAQALAGDFTVYLPDRRGRGLSGPSGNDYPVDRDVDDLAALLAHTGAQRVFGVSSGALITLQAALALPAIRQAAVFEPPLILNGQPSVSFIERYDREMAAGRLAAALVTGMQGAQMGPAFLRLIPRWLMERMTRSAMASEDKQAAPGAVTMRQLAPTLHHDFQLIAQTEGLLARLPALRAELLLLGGTASPAYLQASVRALARTCPQARRMVFPGFNHSATGPAHQGGHPAQIAAALREFFAQMVWSFSPFL